MTDDKKTVAPAMDEVDFYLHVNEQEGHSEPWVAAKARLDKALQPAIMKWAMAELDRDTESDDLLCAGVIGFRNALIMFIAGVVDHRDIKKFCSGPLQEVLFTELAEDAEQFASEKAKAGL